jgi:defect-in-organelle-trafficking protein DotC
MMYADAPANTQSNTPPVLQSLMNAQLTPDAQQSLDHPFLDLHQQAIYGAAFALGAQLGLKMQFQTIWGELNANAVYLDQVYNFQSLLLNEGRVLPPVIEEADNTYQQTGNDEAQTTNTSYQILSQAAVVSVAPNWRNYFPSISTFSSMMTPDPALLPKTDEDRATWKSGALDGWNAGIIQGNQMAQIDLNKLETDFLGMIRFKTLALQGMVSVPMLADGSLGIVVNGQSLAVNETVFRLTMQSRFQRPETWRALPSADAPQPPAPPPAPSEFPPAPKATIWSSVVSAILSRPKPPPFAQLATYGDETRADTYAGYVKSHYVALLGQDTVSVVSGKNKSGSLLYVVRVYGFKTPADATTWCGQAMSVGLSCFAN